MPDPTVDIATLTEDQQLALQQFTAVTDQELDAAVPLLRRCQWNVQIAIARFFDGEPEADPVAEAATSPSPPLASRQESGLNSLPVFPRTARRLENLDAAPRIVPQPQDREPARTSLLLAVLFAPFNVFYRLFARIFGFLGYVFPPIRHVFGSGSSGLGQRSQGGRGRKALSARDTAARFIREFEEEYGANDLLFFENGYAQAYDEAKRDLKYLMVVLISPEHDETAEFVRNTLLSSAVKDFLESNKHSIVLWAGSMQDSEAYQVANGLNCTTFPFTALVVHTPSVSSTAMSVIARISGSTQPAAYVTSLQRAMSRHSEALTNARAVQAERRATQNIRQEQDSAYERSLAQDRARALARREAEDAEREKERREKTEAEKAGNLARNREQWTKWRAQTIKAEPGDEVKDAVRISVRMPSGERAVRKFAPDTPIEEVYAFVECYDLIQSRELSEKFVEKPTSYVHQYGFRLVSPIPRQAYNLEDGGTVKGRIGRSGNLIVEPILEDEERNDD